MSNSDIIATSIALLASAITITLLLIQNARLQRAIRMRDDIVKRYVKSLTKVDK